MIIQARNLAPLLCEWTLGTMLALLPIQWILLYRFASLSVKPLHVQFLLLFGATMVFAPTFFRGLEAVLRNHPFFWMLFSLYLYSLLLASLANGLTGSTGLLKHSIYCGASLLTAALVAALPPERVVRAAFFGCTAGFILFILAAEMSLNAVGDSYVLKLASALARGDSNAVLFGIYKKLFNAQAIGSLDADGDLTTSLRNTLGGCLFVLFVMLNAVKPGVVDLGTCARSLRFAAVILCAFFLVTMLSRSVLLAAAVASLGYVVLRIVRGKLTGSQLAWSVLCSLVLLTVFVASDSVSKLFYDRLLAQTGSYQTRWQQYADTLSVIDRAFFAGHGLDVRIDGRNIHNLFLGAWVRGGLLSFLSAVAFYAAIVGSASIFAFHLCNRTFAWALPLSPEWTLGLLALPLIRVWLGGDNGQFTPPDWVAVGLFFGIVSLNRSVVQHSPVGFALAWAAQPADRWNSS